MSSGSGRQNVSSGEILRNAGVALFLGSVLLGTARKSEAATITVTSTADNTTADGQVTLREAIQAANTDTSVDGSTAGSGADTIAFAPTVTGTITLGGTAITISSDVTISGPGAANLTISGNNASNIFTITDAAAATRRSVQISGLTLTAGSGGVSGAIDCRENLALTNCVVTGNTAVGAGGGIYMRGAAAYQLTANIQNCTISNNTSFVGGGLSLSYCSPGSVTGCTISGNSAPGNRGGGLAVSLGGAVVVDGCTFSGNSASSGGGLSATGAATALTVRNSTLTGNTATTTSGGAIYSYGSTLTVESSTLSSNNAVREGAGIYNRGTLTATNVVISGNALNRMGGNTRGAGLATVGAATLTECTISGNTSTSNSYATGGGIFVRSAGGMLTMNRCTVSGNTATNTGAAVSSFGGGISCAGGMNITNCTISGNTIVDAAPQAYGGAGIGIYNDTASTISNCTITNNRDMAGDGGGGLYHTTNAMYPSLTVQSCIIAGNTTITAGAEPDMKAGMITNVTNSLIGAFIGVTPLTTDTNNIKGTPAAPIDPLLGPLANNGSTTQTHALLAGSPALDTGANPLSLTTDQRGALRTAGSGTDIGAVERNLTAPTATLTNAPAVTSASTPTQYDFTITFGDDFAVNAATIDNADIQVTGPNGFSQLAQFVSVTPSGNGTPRVATYRITPPGGTWDGADNGTYSIVLLANQVTDVDGNATAAATLGTFSVNAGATTTTVKPGEVDSDGDGFTDELEAALGTNAFSALSTPFPNNAPAGPGRDFFLSGNALRISLKFGGKDTIRLRGTIPVPAGVILPGNSIVFDIGGVIYPFSLDSRGRGVNETTNSVARLRTGSGSRRAPQNVGFDLNIRGEDLETKFADEGLTADLVKEKQVNVVVKILFNGTFYRESVPLLYTKTAQRGKTEAPPAR